jgi:glycerophosphoryl diester phosphodiesterase
MTRPLIIAHRGGSSLSHENTLEAFQKAIDLGVDLIEFDIRKTKDNVLVCFHDDNFLGTRLADLTYHELRDRARQTGMAVPAVPEVLLLVKDRIKVVAELKETGYEKAVADLLLQYLRPGDLVIVSFNDESLLVMKKHYPGIKTGLLLGKEKPKKVLATRWSELFPLKRIKRIKADFIAAHYKLLKLGFLSRAKKNHWPVFVWTVNEKKMLKKFMQNKNIAGIITDRPDLALSIKKI